MSKNTNKTKKKNLSTKPIILITNDDGITAPGIHALIEVAKEFGDVVVVAPDSPQSGMGHAITIGKPLRLHAVHMFENVQAFQCSGTPVDCVKLAVDKVLHRKPDICLSGINHGANNSINVIYSGTMSAAMEASIESIPAFGFSYLDYSFEADFELAKSVVRTMLELFFTKSIPQKALYNVNIPKVSKKEFKGIKFCRQANAKWDENFIERKDPHGKKYYWLTGEFLNKDKGKDTDVWALDNKYASVVPVQYDLTDYRILNDLQSI
ncbi:MAG: 5'/3'-nucleotidase SurE [Chitinophagaceae bacterium]